MTGPPPRFWRVVWVVFLLFPLVHLADERASALRVALVVGGLIVFLAFYVELGLRRIWRAPTGRETAALLAVQVAIGIALTTLEDPDWALTFIFLAATAGVRWSRFGPVVALAVMAEASLVAGGGDPGAGLGYAVPALGVGTLMVMIGRLRTANLALVRAREELAEVAVAEERARFARDLHDLLGHSLSVIAIKAELAGRVLDADPATARSHVADIEGVARDALGEVREAVSGYRRPTLAGELAGARLALEAAGVRAEVHDATRELSPEAEAVLAWAVREGVTNVIRHAGARSVSISVGDDGVEVADDGRGDGAAAHGNGLDGLRERVAGLGGTVEAGARASGGFALRVAL